MSPRMFGQQPHLISFGLLHPLQQKQQTETVPGLHRFSLLLLQEAPSHWGQEALAGAHQCQQCAVCSAVVMVLRMSLPSEGC